MAENYFELVGRIGWIEYKSTEKGFVTKICLGVKKDKEEYRNFFITFLNTINAKEPIAENLSDMYRVGDYIRVKGILDISKFTPKNSDKEIENISLIGKSFNAVKFDTFEKRFIDV